MNRSMNLRSPGFAALLSLSSILATPLAFGHGGGGDIALYNNNGQVAVGFAVLDDDDINHVFFDPFDVVHQSILIPQPPVPGLPSVGSSEPGFDADEHELLPNAAVSVALLTTGELFESSLSYWDGTGPVSFVPAVDVTAGYTPLASSDSSGGFHDHPIFGLNAAGLVPDGVYVAEMKVSVDGMLTSDPYYLVALVDQVILSDPNPEDAAEALGALVRAYQADPIGNPRPTYGGKDFTFYADAVSVVPEPAGVLLMLLAGLPLLLSRRA